MRQISRCVDAPTGADLRSLDRRQGLSRKGAATANRGPNTNPASRMKAGAMPNHGTDCANIGFNGATEQLVQPVR